MGRQQLDARLRELAILHVARLSAADYEWVQHVSLARQAGVTEEQIQALAEGRGDADCFDGVERLVLAFTTEVVRDVRAGDATFERMRAQFTPREIVELLLAIGFYMMMARLMETTDIDLDAPAGDRIAAGLR